MSPTILDFNSSFKGLDFQFSGQDHRYRRCMETWNDRLRSEIKRKGWNIKTLADRSGVPYDSVSKYLKGHSEHPRGDRMARLANVLEVSEQWLRFGEQKTTYSVKLIGYVGAAEAWTPIDDHALGEGFRDVVINLDDLDPVALEVRGTSMMPVYREGDILLCSRRHGLDISSAIGQDCVVRTTDGEMLVKRLMKDTGLFFRLRSYNPDIPDRERVRLEWAAPIRFIKRG